MMDPAGGAGIQPSNGFHYSGQDLYCEGVPLADVARAAGTPAYVYSSAAILENYRAYDEALGDLPHTVCYAVKANSTLGILGLLTRAGAGFDIVSGGELYRVMQAGGEIVEEGAKVAMVRNRFGDFEQCLRASSRGISSSFHGRFNHRGRIAPPSMTLNSRCGRAPTIEIFPSTHFFD